METNKSVGVRITSCMFRFFLNIRLEGKTKDSFDFAKPYVKYTFVFGERSFLMLENIKNTILIIYFSHNNWYK